MPYDPKQARETLRSHGLRVTAARLAVLQVLAEAGGPLSHTQVVAQLGTRGGDPATTYRTLVRLAQAGVAPVVSRADGIDRYALAGPQADEHHHPHFVCRGCGRLACLPDELSVALPAEHPWAAAVRGATVQLTGDCPDCQPTG